MSTSNYPQTTFRIPPEESQAVDDLLTYLSDHTGRCPRHTCGATGVEPCKTEDGTPHAGRWTSLQDVCATYDNGAPARHGRAAVIRELLAAVTADPEVTADFIRWASEHGLSLRDALAEAIGAAVGKRAAA